MIGPDAEAPKGMMQDPFSAALARPDLMEMLQRSTCAKYMADPGFLEEIKRLRGLATDPTLENADFMKAAEVGQKIAQSGQRDPRIMQALMILQGQNLIVEESDIKKAESFGDIKRREPIQAEELAATEGIADPEECRTKGNEHFKAGRINMALAHYEKGVQLLRKQEQVDATSMATLLSNAAMCYLKLDWPDRAKVSVNQAIAVVRAAKDESFDQAKLFYRRAIAFEKLREFSAAVDDMTRAFAQAKKLGHANSEQHRLRGEIERLKKLKASDEEDKAKKLKQAENEKTAEVTRMQGQGLEKKEKDSGPVATDQNYLGYQDFTFWTKNKIIEAVKGLVHRGQSGCKVETTELKEESSKIQAEITSKKGKRALYYEMDLVVAWKAKASKKLTPQGEKGETHGTMRVYNIGHDTKFELGGDENTSYIYSMGFVPNSGPWFEDIRQEAAELFDLIAGAVDTILAELRKK